MLNINMEFRKGILFIRLNGKLNRFTSNKINNYVIPLLNKYGIRFIVYNLNELVKIDKIGIKVINNATKIIDSNNGLSYVCGKDKYIENINALKIKNELNVMEILHV